MLSHNMGLWEPMHGSKKLVTDTLRVYTAIPITMSLIRDTSTGGL